MAMRSNLTLLMTDVPSARYSDFASKPFRLAPIPIEPAVAQAETHERIKEGAGLRRTQRSAHIGPSVRR